MKRVIVVSLFLLGSLMMISCEDMVQKVNIADLKIPPGKTVISAYFSLNADTTLLTVGRSVPLNQPDTVYLDINEHEPLFPWRGGVPVTNLPNAEIKVFDETDGSVCSPTRLNSNAVHYTIDALMPIVSGHTYRVWVKSDMLGVTEATCTLQDMPILNMNFLWTESYWKFEIKRIQGNHTRYFICRLVSRKDTPPHSVRFLNQDYLFLSSNEANSSGNIIVQRVKEEGFISVSDGYVSKQLDEDLGMYVMEVDRNVYNFWLRATSQRSGVNDPFASPVTLFTNVVGGLGVVGQVQDQGMVFSP